MMNPGRLWAVLACILIAASTAGTAADFQNFEEGLPVQVEDADPIALREREFHSLVRYDRADGDKDRLMLEPRVAMGLAPDAQVALRVPFYLGNADQTGSGNVAIGLLHQFKSETQTAPALAVAAEGEFPTGRNSNGLDTTLKFIVTRTFTASGLDQLHLNLSWEHNMDATSEERRHRYVAIAGYSRRVGSKTLLVADFVREQERERGRNSNVFELGLRRQLTPITLVALGLGAGIGEESPAFRATAGVQISF